MPGPKSDKRTPMSSLLTTGSGASFSETIPPTIFLAEVFGLARNDSRDLFHVRAASAYWCVPREMRCAERNASRKNLRIDYGKSNNHVRLLSITLFGTLQERAPIHVNLREGSRKDVQLWTMVSACLVAYPLKCSFVSKARSVARIFESFSRSIRPELSLAASMADSFFFKPQEVSLKRSGACG